MTAKNTIAGEMTEAELQANIIELAHADGNTVIFAELKSEKGRLTVDQSVWSMALFNERYHVWRPSDWLSAEIERIVRRE